MTSQTVRIEPQTTEGFYVADGLEAPLPFIANVGDRGPISDFPVEGWDGSVLDGQDQFVDKRVILTRRLEGYNDAVVAYIFDTESTDREIFTGICSTEGLR